MTTYYQAHKAECQEYGRKYYQNHKVEYAKYDRKYQQTEQGKQAKAKAGKKYFQIHKTKCDKYHQEYRKTLTGYLRDVYQCIKQRCNNPKNAAYKYYGARGIECRFESANEFIDYVVNILRIDPRGLTIDRIDNNGHYEPGNIRFIPIAENLKNKRKRYNKNP